MSRLAQTTILKQLTTKFDICRQRLLL